MLDVFRRIARACGASRHASVAACRKARMSAHAHKMFVFVLSALVLCVSLHPTRAYGDVVWAETSDSLMSAYVYDYDYSEYGRRCALAEFVGYNWETASSSVRSKVLEDSTVAFCLDPTNRRCINVAYEWAGDIPVFSQAIEIVFSIFGRQRVWQCSMTGAEYFAVQDAFKNAVYPNDGGGGTTGGTDWDGFPVTLTMTKGNYTSTLDANYKDRWFNVNGNKLYYSDITSMTLTIDTTVTIPSNDYDIFARVYGTNTTSTNAGYASVFLVPTGTFDYVVVDGKTKCINKTDHAVNVYLLLRADGSDALEQQNSTSFEYTVGLLLDRTIQSGSAVIAENNTNGGYFNNPLSLPPYNPQPDPPAQPPTLNAPSAPSLPTTNAPTTPDSTPNSYTTIVNNNYTQPTYNQQPTGTSQDYTPWLDEIIILLRSINDYIYMGFDDLSTWFSAVDNNMRTGFDNVLARLSSLKTGVHSDLVWLADNLDDWISNAALYLATYLHDCEQYLGDIVGEYSSQIASVVTWLRRIYSRLGGNGASKPSVTTDEPGFFDWLINLLTGFLNDLLSNLPEWLQRLIGGFQDLSEHFPFSIPWDIAAMLQLLYHEPVTPVFDLPMPTMEIDGVRSVNVHIDLTSWNGVAAIVREMVFIIFAVSLALNTKKLLSNLDM